MIDEHIIQEILLMPDSEKGGDNALDGFEFQVSSAIYSIFSELRNNNSFALIYEKIEDFIIFSDKIKLYQAKSISRNLTPKLLYQRKSKPKKNSSGLSIIEKMNQNYRLVKEKYPKYAIENNLIVSKQYTFSKKLNSNLENIIELEKLNFDRLSEEVKKEIITETTHDDYDWSKINSIRLIRKDSHEEITRAYIDDVLNELNIGKGISPKALYDSLVSKIKSNRKNKSSLNSKFLLNEIQKYSSFSSDINFNDVAYLLNEEDKKQIMFLNSSFNTLKELIKLNNTPEAKAYKRIKNYCQANNFPNTEEIYTSLEQSNNFNDLFLTFESFDIKALILLIVGKGDYR